MAIPTVFGIQATTWVIGCLSYDGGKSKSSDCENDFEGAEFHPRDRAFLSTGECFFIFGPSLLYIWERVKFFGSAIAGGSVHAPKIGVSDSGASFFLFLQGATHLDPRSLGISNTTWVEIKCLLVNILKPETNREIRGESPNVVAFVGELELWAVDRTNTKAR